MSHSFPFFFVFSYSYLPSFSQTWCLTRSDAHASNRKIETHTRTTVIQIDVQCIYILHASLYSPRPSRILESVQPANLRMQYPTARLRMRIQLVFSMPSSIQIRTCPNAYTQKLSAASTNGFGRPSNVSMFRLTHSASFLWSAFTSLLLLFCSFEST